MSFPPRIGGTRNYARPDTVSVNHYRRLLSAPDLPRCEYDAQGGPHDGGPPDDCADLIRPLSADDCPEWGDQELGVVARGLLAGWTVARIGRELGIPPHRASGTHRGQATQMDQLHDVVRRLRSLRPPLERSKPSGGKGRTRPRSLTMAQEIEAREMYAGGLTIPQVAKRLGVKTGAIHWCLAHPRGQG